jgi:hypothetical protein
MAKKGKTKAADAAGKSKIPKGRAKRRNQNFNGSPNENRAQGAFRSMQGYNGAFDDDGTQFIQALTASSSSARS